MISDQVVIIRKAAQTIYDKKGINILGLDVKGVSTLTDYILIAEGAVDRHVIALAKEVIHVLDKEEDEYPCHIEGLEGGSWVVLDYFHYMIHIFTPGLRDKYQIEGLYPEGKIVDLELSIQPT